MSYQQYTCPSCRTSVWGQGYGPCATCVQTDVIRQGQQQQQEYQQQQQWEQRLYQQQQQIEQANFQRQQNIHNNIVETEARKQTQLLLEQNITEQEAYQSGHDWELNVPTTNTQHTIGIYLKSYPQDMYISQLQQSAFLTPRLDKQYNIGFWQRFEKEKAKAIKALAEKSDDIMDLENHYVFWVCYNSGVNAQKNFTPGYQFDDTEIWARADEVYTKLEIWTDQTTGQLNTKFDQSAFVHEQHAKAYQLGLDNYLETQNTPSLIYQRRHEIKERERRWEETKRKEENKKFIEELTTVLFWALGIGFVVWLFK